MSSCCERPLDRVMRTNSQSEYPWGYMRERKSRVCTVIDCLSARSPVAEISEASVLPRQPEANKQSEAVANRRETAGTFECGRNMIQ